MAQPAGTTNSSPTLPDPRAAAEVERVGRLPDGTVAARFTFTWSFKRRSRPGAPAESPA